MPSCPVSVCLKSLERLFGNKDVLIPCISSLPETKFAVSVSKYEPGSCHLLFSSLLLLFSYNHVGYREHRREKLRNKESQMELIFEKIVIFY